jgi:hypothetical protein
MHPELMKPPPQLLSPEQVEAMYAGYFDLGEKIKTDHVERFNYRFTARFMNIGTRYKLFELIPIKGDAAEHSFLTTDKITGVIIPEPFYQHRLKLKALSPPTQKRLLPKTAFQPATPKKVEPHADKRRRKESRRALPEQKNKTAAVDRWSI